MNESCDKAYIVSTKYIFDNIDFFRTPIILFIILHFWIAFLVIVGNSIIIATIIKSSHLQTPSYLLITGLAFVDLLVGLLHHTIAMTRLVFRLQKSLDNICNSKKVGDIIPFFLVGMCFGMSLLISIDRYLALTLKHRYKFIVTKRRAITVVLVLSGFNLCTPLVIRNVKTFEPYWRRIGGMLGLTTLLLTTMFYIISFFKLRQTSMQVRSELSNPIQAGFNVIKYKKSLNTMLFILLWLLICYVPMLCGSFYGSRDTKEFFLLFQFTLIIFGVNSFTNPIIYVIRFRDIRQESLRLFRNISCLAIDN